MTKSQKEVLDRITIKSVKTMDGLDGTIIDCNIFLDNKKVVNYHNDGRGGCGMTHIFPIKGDYEVNRKKLSQIENLISKLPKINSSILEDTFLDADLDWIVEELVELKNFEKYLKKGICYGEIDKTDCLGLSIPKSYQMISYKKINNLNKLNLDFLKKEFLRIESQLEDGQVIFNDYIKEDGTLHSIR